jgi:hypothetical protein
MNEMRSASRSVVLWQGYHHRWEYNHRLNRFGSYVEQRSSESGEADAIVGHSAASGTGGDTAHFKEFVTQICSAQGVAFLSGHGETVVECQRGDLTPFVIAIDELQLPPELQGCGVYTVVLNGFELCALEHSEKLVTFGVDVTQPVIYEQGTKARFYIVGHLRFDCRSPECQLLPVRLESEPVDGRSKATTEVRQAGPDAPVEPSERPRLGLPRHKLDRAVRWIKRQLTTLMGVEEVKQSLLGEDADSTRRQLFRLFGKRFYLRFLKWKLSAPYSLRVHFLLIGGAVDALAVRDLGLIEHEYRWDPEHEIHREQLGVLPVTIHADGASSYEVSALAFRQMSLDITIDEHHGTEDPIQWGKGMHMLEWNMAIRDIEQAGNTVRAVLDLFYKNWSEAMNEVITLTTWGAVRGAGSAKIGARLTLLQIAEGVADEQRTMPGRLYWPGLGIQARSDPRARLERPVGRPGKEN